MAVSKIINPLNLTGRNILVTGASSGIGRETAILLSQLGAKVILVARREAELHKTKELMLGTHHVIVPFDLTHFDSISSLLKNITDNNGLLSGLVHSAGIQIVRPIRFIEQNDIEKVFSINVNSAFALAKAFRQKGVYHKNSSLVFLASVAGLVGRAGLSAYTASKGAILSLTRSLAVELVRDSIRVNCVAPGLVQTEMLDKWAVNLTAEQQNKNVNDAPLGVGTPKDVANAIAFLLADTARWITGTTLVVDGGYTAN